jgi:preprotein translocase subunit SecA
MMMAQITGDVVRKMFAVQISANAPEELAEDLEGESIEEAGMQAQPVPQKLPSAKEALSGMKPLPVGIDLSKVGRNDECPCNSGKKFKKCHGAHL